MRRTIFSPEHADFRESVRSFAAKEAVGEMEQWESDGIVPREFWTKAAQQGLVGFEVPEEYGGAGVDDFRFNAILDEEMTYAGALPDNLSLQNDILCPYLVNLTTEEQKQRWLPPFTSGELVTAIAMSEPGAGSDLRGIQTTAEKVDGGYVVSGSKTFVTSGIQADLVIVAARMPDDGGKPRYSLLAVEREMEGFTRGRKLKKVGHLAQDTAELFFDDVYVPAQNLVGEEGRGLNHLMSNLPQERLSMGVIAVAAAEKALELAVEYCGDRRAFGKPIGSHQAIRHTLAEMRIEVDVARTYIDRCLELHVAGELSADQAAGAKFWTTELQFSVADRCLQLFGGYGYMDEYPISRIWRDARVQRIYGGTSEIMKEIVGRAMGF